MHKPLLNIFDSTIELIIRALAEKSFRAKWDMTSDDYLALVNNIRSVQFQVHNALGGSNEKNR